MELQLRGGSLFLPLHGQANGVPHQVYCLLCFGLVGDDSVAVELPDHGQIQYALPGVDAGDVRYPFDLVELADAMRAGTDSIMNKAGSKPGEKTILDAMVPAVKVLEDHSKDAPKVAFEAAMRAAAAGFEETRAMKAVWGRAAYYGEKSVGLLDGGAAVGKLIFEAINESCGLTACN